jgi:hypothetical protein
MSDVQEDVVISKRLRGLCYRERNFVKEILKVAEEELPKGHHMRNMIEMLGGFWFEVMDNDVVQ